MKLSRHALTVLTRQYRSVLLKCALINAGLFFAVAPAMAADYTYDPTATVAANLAAFHSAITGTTSYQDGSGNTIDAAFAAANPKITRDALAQLLAGSSDAANYVVETTATGDFIDLTGGTVSKSLGYDLSVGGSDITAKLTGTNAAGSDTVIGAINAVDAAVGDLTGTGVTGATVAAQITALDNDKIDTSKIQATLASATTGEVADAKAVKDALDGKQDKLTNADNGSSSIQISSAGVISVKDTGITNSMLAANAVTTGKIEDGNVTKAKLAATVQDSLDKADSALQASALANTALTGTTTADALKVGGKDVLTTDSTVSADKITGYTGSALETAVGTQISTALANGTNPYQTASDVSTAITTALANGTDPYQTASDVSATLSAYTKTADLAAVATSGAAADVSYDNTTSGLTATNVQAAIDENASAISSLDTRVTTAESKITTLEGDVVMDAAATSSATYTAGAKVDAAVAAIDVALKADETRLTTAEGEITKLTTGTDTGLLNVLEAHIGANGLSSTGNITTTGTANISAGGNLIAGGNISTTSGTIYGKNGSFTGDLGVTGKTTTGTLEAGNTTITGTLSAGATTVNGTFGAGTGGSMFVVDADGDITKAGTIAATGLTTTTSTTALGGASYTNTITGTTNTITGTTNIINGVTQLDASNGMKFGAGGNVAKDIDNGSAARTKTTANNDTTLATVASVLKSAENADFTVGSTTNIGATNNTLGKAITALDGAIGDRSNIGSANTAINNGTKTSVAAGLKAAGDAIGSQTYSNSATVNYGVIAANTDLTTAVSQVASNIGAALTTVADRDASFKLNAGNSVNANLAKLDATIGASVTTTTNGVAATKTVNANIDALNTAMGDVSGVLVNGYTPGNLVGAVNKLDANMNAVLGGIYKADGKYDQTAIKGTNGFDDKTTSNNLTAALKSYADNVMAATGVAYNADGSVATTYTKATTTDYDGLNANSSLKAAIEQLDGNIGAAITGTTRTATGATTSATASVNDNIKALDAAIGAESWTDSSSVAHDLDSIVVRTTNSPVANNGVAKANTVNQNIVALNETIGDLTGLSFGTGATGDAITNGTGKKAATVVEALNNIDATIGNIHGLYDGSKVYSSTVTSTVNGHSNLAVGTTVEDHLVSLDNAIGDRSFATTHYVAPNDDLSTAVTKLDNELHTLNHDVRKLRHDMDRGLASVSALSALIPNARGTGNTTVSVGTGYYNGHSSMALGGAHWFTDNLMVNIGVATSVDRTRNATYRAGLSYSF